MADVRVTATERAIRWTTTLSVIVLAAIAAVVSYKHMYELVLRYGETSWTAALLPISVDGMIVASSMSLLLDSRCGRRSGLLPWTLLVIGSAASVAVAEPSVVGRLIAGWPSCALIGAYELLMGQIRHTAAQKADPDNAASEAAHRTTKAVSTASEEAPHAAATPAYEPSGTLGFWPEISEQAPKSRPTDLGPCSEEHGRGAAAEGARERRRAPQTARRGDASIQQRAWQWAVANRTPTGDLPPGRAIATRFERSERWGRLVKQAGLAGYL